MHISPSVRIVRPPNSDHLVAARRLVHAHLAPSPVDVGGTPQDPSLKLESLQPTGSFKVRGALAAMAAAPPGAQVVTASAGNHGLGIAFAARTLGRAATVVVPENASPAKVDQLRRWGIDLVQTGTRYEDAEAHALALAQKGAYFISAYNDPHVIAGQSTIGYELDTQVEGPLTVVCGVGGGGLAAGLGLWAAGRIQARVVGVQADVSLAVTTAVATGRQRPVKIGTTLADGMASNLEPRSITVDLIARHVDTLVSVTEAEIRTAVRYLATERGYIAEGAGAAAVAAVLAKKITPYGRVVAVVSGRNIASPALAAVLTQPHPVP